MNKILALPLLLLCSCSSINSNNSSVPDQDAGSVLDLASSKPLEKGLGRTDLRFTEISAVVRSVNLKQRTITVIAPDHQLVTVDVDPAVKRLNEIRSGDKIVLQYFQSLAFEVREPTEKERQSPIIAGAAAVKNPQQLPPALGAARSVHAIVTIEGIDRSKRAVTVRGPEGRVIEVEVMNPANLDKIKIGDTVAVDYTEALAVGVDPR